MGIHYDYKSTRGDKAMKKEAKRKARIEQRRAKRSSNSPKLKNEKEMHDIDKPITLEDLTNPDTKLTLNEILKKEDSLLKFREISLKKKKKKERNLKEKLKKKK